MPALEAVAVDRVDGERWEYFSCPLLFIPPAIWDFWRRYRWARMFPGAPMRIEEQQARFIQAAFYYEACLAEEEAEKDRRRTRANGG